MPKLSFVTFLKNLPGRTYRNYFFISLGIGYVLGNFIAGIFMCSACTGVGDRLFFAVVIFVLGIFLLGFIPKDESGTGGFGSTTWGYILATTAVIYILILIYLWISERNNPNPDQDKNIFPDADKQ